MKGVQWVAITAMVLLANGWPDFADKSQAAPDPGLFLIYENRRACYMDSTGKVLIRTSSPFAGEFSEGLAWIVLNERFGYIDTTGKIVIKPQFVIASDFHNGLAAVFGGAKEVGPGAFVGGQMVYIDRSGKTVIKDANMQPFSEGLASVARLKKVGGQEVSEEVFVDNLGRQAFEGGFSATKPFAEGLAPVALSKPNLGSNRRLWGFVDAKGAMAIEPKYDDANGFSEGLAGVSAEGKWGFVDKSGVLRIENKYEAAGPFHQGLAPVCLDGKWGYVDPQGNEVIPRQFPSALPFSEGLAPVRSILSWGYIDKTGAFVVKPAYDEAGGFRGGLARVVVRDQMSYIDRTGRSVWQGQRWPVEEGEKNAVEGHGPAARRPATQGGGKTSSFAAALLIGSSGAFGTPTEAPQSTQEVALCKLPASPGQILPDGMRVSPDNRHIAFALKTDKGAVVTLDGVAGKTFAAIGTSSLEFSPDGTRLAYAVSTEAGARVVLNGSELNATYANIGRSSIMFSPDSQHFVYGVALKNGAFAVVRDQVEGAAYRNIDPLSFTFSADSQHFAYAAQSADKTVIVVDGVPGPPCDKARGFVFSPDGAHSCYVAIRGQKSYLVKDGTASTVAYDEIETPKYIVPPSLQREVEAFTKEGRRHLSYPVSRGPLFSPDSKRLAFHAKRNGKWFCVLDGVESPAFDELEHWPRFSPDSQRFADTGVRANKSIMILDGVETEYDQVVPFTLAFSPDSRHVVWAARRGSAVSVVLDGVFQAGKYRGIGSESVTFSPDSNRLAFCAQSEGGKMFVVVDGKGSAEYDAVKNSTSFSPDSRHVAFCAQRGGNMFVVADGVEGKPYAAIVAEGRLFQPGGSIVYLGIQLSDATIYRVETTFEK